MLDEVPLVLAEQAARAGAAAPVVPYATPGSEEMALSLATALRGPVRAVVIRNHGLFTVGPDIVSALSATLATEEAARIYLLARGIGEPARVPGHAIAHAAVARRHHRLTTRANVTTSTRAAPARRSSRAQTSAVAPVV